MTPTEYFARLAELEEEYGELDEATDYLVTEHRDGQTTVYEGTRAELLTATTGQEFVTLSFGGYEPTASVAIPLEFVTAIDIDD